jgi:hypothetical protein
MFSRHLPSAKVPISWVVMAFFAACASLFPGCSEGESGLVLGGPGAVGGAPTSSAGRATHAGEGFATEGGESDGGGQSLAGVAGAAPADFAEQVCSPLLTFENRDASGKGALFDQAVPNPSALAHSVSHDVCRTLYRVASEVKPVERLVLVVEDFEGVAATSNQTMRLSSRHLQTMAELGVNLQLEIAGVLHFTVANVYQHDASGAAPTWLITGIADFVRLDAGLIDPRERAAGGSYADGSKTAAFFLDFLWALDNDVVYKLNQRLAPPASSWSDQVFVELTGRDLTSLWSEYQASF